MSREIDLTKPLSDDDKQYLIQRGREYDVQQNEQLTSEPQQIPHTGDVDTELDTAAGGGITRREQPTPSGAASAAAAAGMPGIVTEEDEAQTTTSTEDDEDEEPATAAEPLEAPYDREGVTKKMLQAEIRRRNALPENAEYEDIPTSGSKDDLVKALEEDDEASE